MAHLHLGLLAYWVVNTIRHQLKKNLIALILESFALISCNVG
jgi:hypothetical protein